MPVVRQLIAIVLLLAMIGGARACLLIEHHVAGAKSVGECQDAHSDSDDESCAACSTPASLSATEPRLPAAPELSFEAIAQTVSVLLKATAKPLCAAAEAPPDDPPSARGWFERMARAWPARGPNF